MFDFIIKPIGAFFLWMYNTIAFHNYGLTIIYFTIIVQLLMIPLVIKRNRSSLMMQKINPQLQHLQKKYGNDRQKLQEEQQKLYESIGYNPMSGCMPMLIQLPVIMILWQVIGSPLQYVFNWSTATIQSAYEIINKAVEGLNLSATTAYSQISVLLHRDLLPPEFFVENGVSSELFNMNFLGINLGRVPEWKPAIVFGNQWKIYVPLFLIAVFSAVLSFFMNKITMKMTQPEQTGEKTQGSAAMNGCMSIYMPLISLWLAFKFPVGLSIYWMTSSIVSTILQGIFLNVVKKQEAQKEIAHQQEMELRKKIIEEQKRAREAEAGTETETEAASQNDTEPGEGSKEDK